MNELAEEQLTLFQEDFPASHFPWLESKKAKGMTVTSGRRCSELSESLRRIGSSVRTYLESCELPLTTFARIWSVRATKSGYSILKLRLSEHRTGESESHLLPTPVSTLGTNGGPNQRDSNGRPGLQMAARLWATPNTMDYLPPRSPEATERLRTTARKGRSAPSNLREQVDSETMKLWPTPRANDAEKRGMVSNDPRHGLPGAVLWPTPRANEYKDVLQSLPPSRIKDPGKDNLTQRIARTLLPTPTTRDYKSPDLNPESRRYQQATELNSAIGGQLNPTWVEWLQGFPLGWTCVCKEDK